MTGVFETTAGVVERDVEYTVAGGQRLYLDASVPEGTGPFAAAILVHGGGWVRGDRRVEVAPLFAPLQAAGIAWFSIDYRLAHDWLKFGEAVHDVQAAVAFVRRQAARFRIDGRRLALIGESAGGQLAEMAALRLTGSAETVQAVVALYTPHDLVALARGSALVPDQIRAAVQTSPLATMLMGRLRALSPIDNVRAGAPPFLLVHGTADRLVPYEQSVAMQQRLRVTGVACDLISIDGGGHGIRWWEHAHAAEAAIFRRQMIGWLRARLAA